MAIRLSGMQQRQARTLCGPPPSLGNTLLRYAAKSAAVELTIDGSTV